MEKRHCVIVINQMIDKIPKTERDFLHDLNWNLEDAAYKAPEETIQWVNTAETLKVHIGKPSKEWHFEVLSIFSTISINELKAHYP